MTQRKYSSSLSWQSSETKPKTNLVSKKTLLWFEYNKSNKQIAHNINLFFKKCVSK